jgi:hypothetical protein
MQISRRNVLKMAGGAALGVVAAPALTGSKAMAAGPVRTAAVPGVLPESGELLGTASCVRLWGTKTVRVPKLVNGKIRKVRVKVPKVKNVRYGMEEAVVNTGSLGVVHDGYLPGGFGISKHINIFGHRTTHGGPMRKLNLLKAGDIIDICGSRYEVLDSGRTVEAYIWATDPVTHAVLWGKDKRGRRKRIRERQNVTGILNDRDADFAAIDCRLSFIACSKQNKKPTDTDYRLIVHAKYIGPTPAPV